MTPLASIILVAESDNKKTVKVIKRLSKSAKETPFEIVIITNGTPLKLSSRIKHIPIKVLDCSAFSSKAQSYNYAINQALGEYIVYIENHIIPKDKWLESLIYAQKTLANTAIVGSKIIEYKKSKWWQRFTPQKDKQSAILGCKVTATNNAFLMELNSHKNSYTSTINHQTIALTQCFIVSKYNYKQVGGLSDDFKFEWALLDLSLKLHQLGYTHYCHLPSEVNAIINPLPVIDLPLSTDTKFYNRWHHYLKNIYWYEKVHPHAFSYLSSKTVIAISVTDHGDDVTAGDFFTASELATPLKSLGFDVVLLSRLKNQWYDIPEKVDLLINLLDEYDLNTIPKRSKKLITIAWTRNWFDKWCETPCFNQYDIVLASSKKACDYINANSRQTAHFLPIATNPENFQKNHSHDCSQYKSDLCFTGSYWGFPRDIMKFMAEDSSSQYNFHVYGANWENIKESDQFNKGFIAYHQLPCVYHNTKIVIDDANHVTKPYGSVNSRVFDALMSGTLVITNGVIGSQELFSGQLPFYETTKQLQDLIHYYLNNESKRKEKIDTLKSIVLKQHTYLHRADSFHKTLKEFINKTSIAIKIPAPSWEEAHEWGDYHMAVLLKKQLQKLNYRVLLQALPEWDNQQGNACDVVIVFRGLSEYSTKSHQINLMWNISHPDKVSLSEYESYDKIFIASNYWSKHIAKHITKPVECLLQCTDIERFHPPSHDQIVKHNCQLLYVGNSRLVYRETLKNLLPTSYDLHVYGNLWQDIIPDEHIKGEYIDNKSLYQYYGSCDILLNDHWQDMSDKGFISNRIFDALACGALIITDQVNGFDEFEKYVVVYQNSLELKQKIEYYIKYPDLRILKTKNSRSFIKKSHTYFHRAQCISETIKSLLQ